MLRKGLSFFVLFIGSLILAAVVLLLVFGKFPLAVSEASIQYDASYNAEAIGSIISSFSTEEGDIGIVYLLPKGECELEIKSSSVRLKIFSQQVEVEEKTITLGEKEATYNFLTVQGITVNEFSTSCSSEDKKTLQIQKTGNVIKVSE